MTTICRSDDLTVPPLVGGCLCNQNVSVLVWSKLEICVDSGQNQRLQYIIGWAEKRDGSRSEMLQVKDAEFVRVKGLTIPTALDYSPHWIRGEYMCHL